MDIDFNFFYKELKVSVCLLYEVNMIFLISYLLFSL